MEQILIREMMPSEQVDDTEVASREDRKHCELHESYASILFGTRIGQGSSFNEDLMTVGTWFSQEMTTPFSKSHILAQCNIGEGFTISLINNKDEATTEKKEQDRAFETIIVSYLNPLIDDLYGSVMKYHSAQSLKGLLLDPVCNFLRFTFDRECACDFINSIIELAYSTKRSDHLSAFLMIIPFLEAGLRDALYIYDFAEEKKGSKESLLSRLPTFGDVLDSEELTKIFGNDISFLLKMCYGTQNTLNLRNVILHGFMSSEDFDCKHLIFLLFFMANMSVIHIRQYEDALSKVEEKYMERFIDKVNSRKMLANEIDWTERVQTPIDAPDRLKVSEQYHEELKQFLSSEDYVSVICDLVDKSKFTIPNRIKEWKDCLLLYLEIVKEDYTSSFKIFRMLSQLFPIFEHSLRRVFAVSNIATDEQKDDRHRWLLVERGRSLVIFDTILTNRPNEYYKIQENGLFKELGLQISNMLFDLFKWPSNVKIRVLLSHGCIHWNWIPREYVHLLMLLLFELLVKYYPQPMTSNFMKFCRTSVEDYTPCFHPRQILKGEIAIISELFEQMAVFESDGYFTEVLEHAKQFNHEGLLPMNVKTATFEKISLLREEYLKYLDSDSTFEKLLSVVVKRHPSFEIEDIAEKELKVFLLALRMSKEIQIVLQHFVKTLSKVTTFTTLSSSKKTSFIHHVDYLQTIKLVCEYCTMIQLGILIGFTNEGRIAGCDRFISQFHSSLPKNHLSKTIEYLLAFLFSPEELTGQHHHSLKALTNKSVIKNLFHNQLNTK